MKTSIDFPSCLAETYYNVKCFGQHLCIKPKHTLYFQELASCHTCGAKNTECHLDFLENLCTPRHV